MLVSAPSTLTRLAAHMFTSYNGVALVIVVSKVIGATIWCLEVYLAFDMLAHFYCFYFIYTKSCPPTMLSSSICIMSRGNNQTWNQTMVRSRIGGRNSLNVCLSIGPDTRDARSTQTWRLREIPLWAFWTRHAGLTILSKWDLFHQVSNYIYKIMSFLCP